MHDAIHERDQSCDCVQSELSRVHAKMLLNGGVRITQVFLNLIRRVHCVSPPSLLCLQLCLHLASVHNFHVIGGAGNVRKFAYRTRNHCGSNEYCKEAVNGAKKR